MGCPIGTVAARGVALLLAGTVLEACAGGAGGAGVGASIGASPVPVLAASAPSAPAPNDTRYDRLLARVERFEIGGAVRTEQGHVLPEVVTVEIRSEICVESRRPGSRFWSLDYDTCLVWTARDTVDTHGEYNVSVPCLDADKTYQSRDDVGELRLVPRGPVTYLAESDAGWRIQDTFATSRSQRRDLVLELSTDRFFLVGEDAPLRSRPREGAEILGRYDFGRDVDVIRFHQGWAECLMDGRIGWMELRFLGTEEEMKDRAPFREKPPLRGTDRGEGATSP